MPFEKNSDEIFNQMLDKAIHELEHHSLIQEDIKAPRHAPPCIATFAIVLFQALFLFVLSVTCQFVSPASPSIIVARMWTPQYAASVSNHP